jgi:hypothetical protein
MKRVKLTKKVQSPEPTQRRLDLFGPPPLIEGEDAAAYNELLLRVSAAVKPTDIIEEMFTADVVSLEWEVLRWRRLKATAIRTLGLKALEDLLAKNLDYGLYADRFADVLAEILQQELPKDQAEDLACQCANNEPEAVRQVNDILDRLHHHLKHIMNYAEAEQAQHLVQEYCRHEADAVRVVDELLTEAGTSLDLLAVNAVTEKLDHIERIDRLTAVAEVRRNASLREIDRRRMGLGAALRRTVQEVEHTEFKVIESTPGKGQKTA